MLTYSAFKMCAYFILQEEGRKSLQISGILCFSAEHHISKPMFSPRGESIVKALAAVSTLPTPGHLHFLTVCRLTPTQIPSVIDPGVCGLDHKFGVRTTIIKPALHGKSCGPPGSIVSSIDSGVMTGFPVLVRNVDLDPICRPRCPGSERWREW